MNHCVDKPFGPLENLLDQAADQQEVPQQAIEGGVQPEAEGSAQAAIGQIPEGAVEPDNQGIDLVTGNLSDIGITDDQPIGRQLLPRACRGRNQRYHGDKFVNSIYHDKRRSIHQPA